jgi:hypothetical protein
MSFYTSVVFYRPRKPPAMTASDIARFIVAIRGAKVLTRFGSRSLSVKFGKSIDKDHKGTTWEKRVAPGIAEVHEIKWDVELDGSPSLQDIIDCLNSDHRRIYRAHISLGMPIADVLRDITRTNSAENRIDYCPDQLSIYVGPVELCSLSSSTMANAGWISASLHGSGYLFPWTVRELVQRAQSSRAIRRISNLCRSFWPVVSKPPPKRVIGARRQLGDLWPYNNAAKPWDWYWGVQETG